MQELSFKARFRKHDFDIHLSIADPSNGQVATAIAAATGADEETIKLLVPGRKGQMLRLLAEPSQPGLAAGLKSGIRVEVYASTKQEVEQVRSSKDLPGLASFEQELKQTMRRQRGSRDGTLKLPSGAYIFRRFEAWQHPGLSPVPSEALKLLHRLAADPGIVGIMTKHHWSVGLLSEMPPEGKVGVSPVCILGVNINAGQEISLRLRTDDLKGFRRYDRIRETLCHELAHMVWGEHDNRFKELNSQLLKECSQLDWTGHAGHAVSGMTDPAFENPAEPMWVDEDNIMAVTAQSSGQTLRQLAGSSQNGTARVSTDPRRAAAMAASARMASAAGSPSSSRSASPEASRLVTEPALPSPQEGAVALSSSSEAAGAEVAINPDADIASMGHRDPSTEQAEEAMRALGSTEFAHQAADLNTVSAQDAAKDNGQLLRYTAGLHPHIAHHQLPQQQTDDKAEAAASSARQHESLDRVNQSPVDLMHMPEASFTTSTTINVNRQPSPPAQAQRAQHAQHGAAVHQAAAQDTPMEDTNAHELNTKAQETNQQQSGSAQLEQAADQQAAPQQDDSMVDADPDDPAVQRYRKAEAAIVELQSQAGAGLQAALGTLSRILQNIASHPGEAKYTHIRLGNATFHNRAGQYSAAQDLLRVAGFSEEAAGTADKALVWKRNDQGLIWLTLSAVKSALSHI